MATSEAQKLQGWRFIVFNLCLGLSHVLVIFNAGAYMGDRKDSFVNE